MTLLLGHLLLAAVLLAPGLWTGPSLDPAVFTQVAAVMADGGLPYADAWDHKPPGLYLLLAGAQAVLPFLSPWSITWGLSVLATAGIGAATTVAVRRTGVTGIAALIAGAAATAGTGQYLVSLGGGLSEPFATLPVAVALVLALAPGPRPATRELSTIGLLLSVAVLISLQLVVGAVAVATVVIARADQRGRVLAWMILVGLFPPLIIGGWLSVVGALPAALDALLEYAVAYRAVNEGEGVALSSALIAWTTLAELFLLLPALLGLARLIGADGTQRLVGVVSAGWVAVSILLFVLQGRFFAHYAAPLVVPLALLAAPTLDRLVQRLRSTPRLARRAVLAAPFVVVVLISAWAGATAGHMEWREIDADNRRAQAVAARLHGLTAAGDRIWVWGNQPQVYLHARRPQATRFVYLYPLTTPGYSTPLLVASVRAGLEALPPRVVVDAGSSAPGEPGFPALLRPRPVATDGRDLDILDPLRDYVAENYREVAVVDGWVLYVLGR